MSTYASQSTMIYWQEISPGKFVRKIKEAVKPVFSNELNKCQHRIRATKKSAK